LVHLGDLKKELFILSANKQLFFLNSFYN